MPAPKNRAGKHRWALGLAMPLALLAFSSAQVRYLDLALNTTTRWLFLAFLIVALAPRRDLFRWQQTAFAKILVIYIVWCIATLAWSAVPLLSVLKVTALVLTATIFISAGYAWAARHATDNLVGFLLPVLAVAAFAALPGPQGFSSTLYQGMSLNPNDLGILAAATLPLPVYHAYHLYRKAGPRRAFGWAFATLIILGLIWLTSSRASMLCAALIFGAFTLAVSPSFRVTAIVFGGLAIAVVYLYAPSVNESFYEDVVAKSAANGDVLYSRRETWGESYDAAMQGGLLGLGYGVAAGFTDFQFGLTSNTYGREKGNSQLAVWEETGFVGLVLYGFLMVALALELSSTFARMPTAQLRVQYALLGGLCVGLLAQSVFEAWWTAPGSAEFTIFFSAIGVLTAFRKYRVAPAAAPSALGLSARRGLLPSAGRRPP